jgi:hypothetical protein
MTKFQNILTTSEYKRYLSMKSIRGRMGDLIDQRFSLDWKNSDDNTLALGILTIFQRRRGLSPSYCLISRNVRTIQTGFLKLTSSFEDERFWQVLFCAKLDTCSILSFYYDGLVKVLKPSPETGVQNHGGIRMTPRKSRPSRKDPFLRSCSR